ncbi:MAG: biopolymer transporter ExbD [Phycisphaerae bacterium]|nr:biopolymer transporter ExbD [Phycisphaerae bacterium]
MMLTNWKKRQSFDAESFDMTPIIDVVFLLIIFFMLVCQFIAAEQFQVQVPDQISSAQKAESAKTDPLTITVMATEKDNVMYAIGSGKLGDVKGKDLEQLIRSEIDRSLTAMGTSEKTVRLRCDKSITFGQVKYILSGISKSNATNLDWAVLSE